MKKINLLFVVLLSSVLLFSACETETLPEVAEEDTLIFGLSYGFCFGDQCVQLFKLEEEQLFKEEGIERLIFDEPINFLADPMPQRDYDLATVLRTNFPESLLTSTDTIIGIPDAYDQGGIYIAYNDRYWLLDTNIEILPENLQPYAELVKEIWLELVEE